MPIPALTLLLARVQAFAYDPGFLANGVTDLTPFGLRKTHTLWAFEPRVGKVRHGHISRFCDAADPRSIWTFDGTLIPKGDLGEWLDDMDAFLTASPWNPGDKVHRGMLRFFESMVVVDDATGIETPILTFIAANPEVAKGAIYQGHSLGTFTATCACLEGHGSALILFAAPKPGDSAFRQTALESIIAVSGILESYANPNDVVPKVPLTVDWPWKVEDFESLVVPTVLRADLVTPPIPSDWASSHHMPNYLALLEAVP